MNEPAKTTAVEDARKPGCPRCGIGTPIFKDSCIVCCSMPDSHAALLHEVLNHKLRAEAQLSEQRTTIARLERELRQERHEFQNFHEQLCKRFGYGHDPVDWKRDQVSMIEHIVRSCGSVARRELDVAWTERNELLKRYCDRTTEAIELQAQVAQLQATISPKPEA